MARAEALHVDGHFAEAAALWQRCADAAPADWEAALKAAISLIVTGAHAKAAAYLELADQRGASRSAAQYVRAQHAMARGETTRAFDLLADVPKTEPESADCLCMLGVLNMRLRRRWLARRWTKTALRADPAHGPSLCNAALLGFLDDPIAQLATLALRTPERVEPLRIAARLLGTEGFDTAIAARGPSPLPISPDPADQAPLRRVTLQLALDTDGVTLTLPLPASCPEALLAHPGFHVATHDGTPLPRPEAPHDGPVAALRYDLTGLATGARLSLHCPLGAAPMLWRDCGGCETGAHWDLRFEPAAPTRWAIETGGAAHADQDPHGLAAPMIVAPAGGEVLSGRLAAVHGAASRLEAARALATVERSLQLWQRLLPECRAPRVHIEVVPEPRSTLCYCRGRTLRVPQAVLRDDRHLPILIHETGHLWWGNMVGFAAGGLWLAEALAEYGLHLAEDDGLVEGYRRLARKSIVKLSQDTPGALPALARAKSPAAQYLCRARGGFAIAMLAAQLGPDRFKGWLGDLARHDGPVLPYDALALASWRAGRSLNFLTADWVMAEAPPRLDVQPNLAQTATGYTLTLTATLSGGAPLGPVPLHIALADGTTHQAALDLALPQARLALAMPARPLRVTLDPSARWLLHFSDLTFEVPDEIS